MTKTIRMPQPRTLPREMSIQRALEWAFGAEKAQVDFDATGAHEFDRVGVDPLWRGMQLAILGTAVDGGGTSDPHPDAQIIASVVEAVLPRHMALRVVELARAGRVPDWRGDATVRVVPHAWHLRKDGEWVAETRHMPEVEFVDAKYRRKAYRPEVCPIRYAGGASAVSRARRDYLEWWGALLEVLAVLRHPQALTQIKILGGMPPMTPWEG